MSSFILGIDTSCDDTSAAVVADGRTVLSNVIGRQEEFHQKWGGIVPEIAARKHAEALEAVIEEALSKAEVKFGDLSAIAGTTHPGLIGALVVGIASAKALAFALGVPFIPVNHLWGHVYSLRLLNDPPPYPLVCLVAAGGHTLIILARGPLDLQFMGTTMDDAAGEAFDKVAKVCGLGYPGGPIIANLAEQGDPNRYEIPRPMLHSKDFHCSFSGLKTNVRLLVEREGQAINLPDLAAGVQTAIVEVLSTKLLAAAGAAGVRTVAIAGGVAANRHLRETLATQCAGKGWRFACPPPVLCTDNGAMIAGLGYHLWKAGEAGGWDADAQASVYLRPETFAWNPVGE